MNKLTISIPLFILFYFISNLVFAQCPESQFCDSCSGINVKESLFLQNFPINRKSKKEEKPVISMNWNKGTTYIITLCNADKENHLILSLYNEKEQFLTCSYNEPLDKYFDKITFICRTTGTYTFGYFFEDKDKGCGLISVGSKKKIVKAK